MVNKHCWCIRIWLHINLSVIQLTETHSHWVVIVVVVVISTGGVHKLFQAYFIYMGVGLHLFQAQTYIFFTGWEWIHTWTWEYLYRKPLTNNRNGNTTHNNTQNVPGLLCPQDKFKLAFNNSVPEHYIQACILYTTLNCQTLVNCCRAHKSQQTPTRNFKEPEWQWHKCVSKH